MRKNIIITGSINLSGSRLLLCLKEDNLNEVVSTAEFFDKTNKAFDITGKMNSNYARRL
jgi:hypothetical protein